MSKTPATPKNFESAVSALESIVTEMEAGSLTLEEALERYERGVGLLQYCQQTLQNAELKVRQLETEGLAGVLARTEDE